MVWSRPCLRSPIGQSGKTRCMLAKTSHSASRGSRRMKNPPRSGLARSLPGVRRSRAPLRKARPVVTSSPSSSSRLVPPNVRGCRSIAMAPARVTVGAGILMVSWRPRSSSRCRGDTGNLAPAEWRIHQPREDPLRFPGSPGAEVLCSPGYSRRAAEGVAPPAAKSPQSGPKIFGELIHVAQFFSNTARFGRC
jgi:hypothetical protein